jgi:SAM-dependent methyltransferase
MPAATTSLAEPAERLNREQTFWDDTYRPGSRNHRKYLWVKYVEETSHIAAYFNTLLRGFTNQRILSIGGGVDRVAVRLAQAGNYVTSLDVSPVAIASTLELARRASVADRVTGVVGSGETLPFGPATFDVVICKRALHHMDVPRAVRAVQRVLADGGAFFAEEPVCLNRLLRWMHKKLPFHPEIPITADERELAQPDLELIGQTFRQTHVHHFDLFARESLAYLLWRCGLSRLLPTLGRLDDLLLNRLATPLRTLGGYVIVQALK